jgi:hypothetical protein
LDLPHLSVQEFPIAAVHMPHGFIGNVSQIEALAEVLKATGTFPSARLVAAAVHAVSS